MLGVLLPCVIFLFFYIFFQVFVKENILFHMVDLSICLSICLYLSVSMCKSIYLYPLDKIKVLFCKCHYYLLVKFTEIHSSLMNILITIK